MNHSESMPILLI